MFNFVENISCKLGNYIGKNDTQENMDLYIYSIFGIISTLISELFGITLSFMFGYFLEYIICDIIFMCLRRGCGGYHCSTFKHCFLVSNIIIIFACIFSSLLYMYTVELFLTSIFISIWIFPNCPKPTEHSPSRGYKEDIRFRKIYRNYLLIFELIGVILYSNGYLLISSSIFSGIIITAFCVTDIFEKFMEIILTKNKIASE